MVGGTGRRWAPVRFQPLTMEPPVRDVDLFQLALGPETPWHVEQSEFDAEGKRLDLYIDFHPGGTFACPECGGRGCKAMPVATVARLVNEHDTGIWRVLHH